MSSFEFGNLDSANYWLSTINSRGHRHHHPSHRDHRRPAYAQFEDEFVFQNSEVDFFECDLI